MKKNTTCTRLALAAALTLSLTFTTHAQQGGAAPAAAPAASNPNQPRTFDQAAASVQEQLAASLAELDALRRQIADEKIPMSRQLSEAEAELSAARLSYQQTSRLLDSRTLDLSNLRAEIKSRQDETTYLSNLLGEYIRNFESRLHIAELQRYETALESAKLAPENSTLNEEQVFQAQAALLSVSLERLHDALGGTRFDGSAVDADGLLKEGQFVLLGPVALFRSSDGQHVGTAEQRLGSLEPAVMNFGNPEDTASASTTVSAGSGSFPLDASLGNAHKIEATQETLWEHIKKGGPVMWPIFLLAGAALVVVLYKWWVLSKVQSASAAQVGTLLDAVARGDRTGAQRIARGIQGPAGEMLAAGAEQLGQPRELIEEVMFEKVLSTRLRLQSLLPFVAISASAAPLLGLLGTVTGIMNTFTLITVFGTGDVKTLSSGISEALITTEYGLIVAIPSLLLHAFLSRKARGMIDEMDQSAVAFINQVSRASTAGTPPAAAPPTGIPVHA
ncbi:MAG: MotA/TolQ/ExbB proton channel family protein [Planctomycetota bacterium]